MTGLDELLLGSALVSLLVYVLVEPVVEGAISHVAATSYLGGRARWQDAAALGLRRSVALIAARLLVTAAVLVVFVPPAALLAVAVVTGSALLGVLGGVLVLGSILAALLVWSLFAAAPAAIIDPNGLRICVPTLMRRPSSSP